MKQTLKARGGVQTSISKDENMNLSLLLDLDNTLLDSSMDTFLPAYFQALSGFFADQVSPDLMLSALMAGTRKMMANDDPSHTLQQVFDSEFFPFLDVEREYFQPRFDQFYEEIFPTLSHLTRPRPEAIALVEWALGQGCQLAVATNPLFPLMAIHQRMRWAGLPPEEIPFVVVSAYESFHFSKPNPAYFAEVLGRMGWPDGSVLMVGDDPKRDLAGSHVLGLPTYWINSSDDSLPDGIDLAARGSIGDLRPWLESTDLSTLEPAFSSPEALVALMLSIPAVIAGLLPSISKSRPKEAGKQEPPRSGRKPAGARRPSGMVQAIGPDLTRRPVSDEWSLTEVICHLRDTELEVNLPRLNMLLELDEPFIPARVTDAWAVERDYNNQDIVQALKDFTSARMQTVKLLRGLTDEWGRKARHAIFGPTDMKELVNFIVEHDKLHIRQIWSTIKQLSG